MMDKNEIDKLNEIEQGQIDTGVYQKILDKLMDLVNNQVSIPPEIQQCIDDHFFEMLL